MAYSFTERGPLEAGFAEVFHSRIVPILERAEATRREARATAIRYMGVAGAAGAGGLGTGLAVEYETAGFVAGVLGGMGTGGVYSYHAGRWKAGLSRDIVPILCDFLGDMRPGRASLPLGRLAELGVVPHHHRSEVEDAVEGTHKGLDWAVTEAQLTRRTRSTKGRTRTRTVFRGLVFRIAVDNPAPRIVFARDRGTMLNWISESFSGPRTGLEKIDTGHPEFERTYEVYSDAPERARAYIGPGLVEGLLTVARAERGGGHVACAFEGDSFWLALPRRGDFLSLGSLFRPTHDIEDDLHRALADLDLPRKVIDALTGR